MKPHPTKSKPDRRAPIAKPKPPLSPARLWLFRITALLLPVLALGAVEVCLRLFGYGYSTCFFKTVEEQGTGYLINNDDFSLRFFPPELARWPGTLKIPAKKPEDTTRIFVFGESAAMGDPQPAYGASRYLEVLLRNRFPERKFEVINVAFTAINSHVILPIARECAKYDGDFWIVYMGNNEMVGPFGAATVFGSQAPPRSMVQLNLAIQRLRVGQLAMAGLRKLGGKPAHTTWDGMRMFMQNQIPPDDPRREKVYQNFEANLRDILRAGLDSGAKVVLSTMSVNLKDCPPFASIANSNLPTADREQFQRVYEAGLNLVKQGQDVEAAQNFEQASRMDSRFAELQYRWADCLRRTSNSTALEHYQAACDLDALPFRADTPINSIIRRVGAEFAGAGLVLCDTETGLAAASPSGIAGQEVFFEHVHFNCHGNYLLGRLWAEQIAKSLPAASTSNNAPDWASQETCERALGLTPWTRGFVIDLVIGRMQRPPLNNQFNNPARLAELHGQLNLIREQQAVTNAVVKSAEELSWAINQSPRDHFLYEAMANFLESLGDRQQATKVYRKLLELLPHDFYGNLQLGRLLVDLGQSVEAEKLLRRAATQRPGIPDAWVELGDACMAQKKYSQALEAYERAAKFRPHEASYVSCVAMSLARLNRRTEAIAAFRRAIELRPDSWETRFELATELASDNQVAEALREYSDVIRLNPNHTVSHINFGVLLARQNRLDEAIRQFELALQLDPTNAAAADYLSQVTQWRGQRK